MKRYRASTSTSVMNMVSSQYSVVNESMACLHITVDLRVSSMDFTLHTGSSVSPPEFTIICRTEGGPATRVTWRHGGIFPEDYEQSQIIMDTSQNSVYENRLRVRGRESGIYACFVMNMLMGSVPGYIIVNGLCVAISTIHDIKQSLSTYSCRRAPQSDCCHLSVQQYTCQYYCVLGVTSHVLRLCDLLPA